MNLKKRLVSELNDSSVLIDPTGNIYNKKWFIWKIISKIKNRTFVILTESDVKKWYYYSRKHWLVRLEWDCENTFCYIRDKDTIIIQERISRTLSLVNVDFSWYPWMEYEKDDLYELLRDESVK